eukprot:scaffold4078_cov68-Phaeocystis_antarctica.AAC.30
MVRFSSFISCTTCLVSLSALELLPPALVMSWSEVRMAWRGRERAERSPRPAAGDCVGARSCAQSSSS